MSASGTDIIGGGIVGLSIAWKLFRSGSRVTVIEKEGNLAAHQTGRNSGVIHVGQYYKPECLKAQLCTEGDLSMEQFAGGNDIPFEITGKLLLGTKPKDLERLTAIGGRAVANKVAAQLVRPERIRELEPYASGLAALHVKPTGIID